MMTWGTQIFLPLIAMVQTVPAQNIDPRQMLLAQMRDIKTPEPLSWWPFAPGWWMLAFLLLAVVTFATTSILQRRKQQRYRAIALQELARLSLKNTEPSEAAKDIMQLLKRTFFSAYPGLRFRASSVFGAEFLDLLQQISPKTQLSKELRNFVFTLLYKPSSPDARQLLEGLTCFANEWIKDHPRATRKNLQRIVNQLNNHSPVSDAHQESLAHV